MIFSRGWILALLVLKSPGAFAADLPTLNAPLDQNPTEPSMLDSLPVITSDSHEISRIDDPWSFAFTSAISVPQPLMIGFEVKNEHLPNVSWFLEGGYFKYPLGSATRSLSDYSVMAGARYHPFSNWFYVTGELGYRDIRLNVDISNLKSDNVPLANTAVGTIDAMFAGALVGGQWYLGRRVAMAFDLGIQYPLPFLHGGNVKIIQDPSQADGTDNSVDATKPMKRISSIPLPQIALMRFIWFL